MLTVLVTEAIHPDALGYLRQDMDAEAIEGWKLTPRQFAQALPEADAILVRVSPIDRRMIEAATRLKVISKHGVGCDNIDARCARERGIEITVAADANTDSVAEHTLMFILALAKNLGLMDRALRRDYAERSKYRVVDVAGRNTLVLGYGRIGRKVAALCHAFAMDVTVHDPLLRMGETPEGFPVAASLDEALEQTDILTLHLPLTPQTKGLMDRRRLRLLRPGAFVVNCARGGIIDEGALAELAASGHLGGVASDVFSVEPVESGNPLLGIDGALLTPHTAAFSEESMRRMGLRAARNIRDALAGALAPGMRFAG